MALGTQKEMRLYDLINEDLHQTLEQLKTDAVGLETASEIELVPGWEETLPKLLHRYVTEQKKVWNTFEDPEYKDEDEYLEALLVVTIEFLTIHGLATKK